MRTGQVLAVFLCAVFASSLVAQDRIFSGKIIERIRDRFDGQKPDTFIPYSAAYAKALACNEPFLVAVYMDGCGPCEELKKQLNEIGANGLGVCALTRVDIQTPDGAMIAKGAVFVPMVVIYEPKANGEWVRHPFDNAWLSVTRKANGGSWAMVAQTIKQVFATRLGK